MGKPKMSSGRTQTKSLRGPTGRRSACQAGLQRFDPPHEAQTAQVVEPSAASTPAASSPAEEPIRVQADQLAEHLRIRQKELDHRESQLNSQAARLESQERAARLWLSQREAELSARAEQLDKRQEELSRCQEALKSKQTAAQSARREQEQQNAERRDKEAREFLDALAARHKLVEEAETRLAEAQKETQKLRDQLTAEREKLEEYAESTRQRMDAEHRQAMAELQRQREAVQRRADHVDQCRAALKQLRAELGAMHRETLEVRLATEELWARLSGAAPPAALTRSLGNIRSKLAEQYAQANAELAERKKELEAIRAKMVAQHESLVQQKLRIEQWTAGQQEQCQQQAAMLVAREEQLQRENEQHRRQSQRWQVERLRLQQELRRLQAELAEREATCVLA